MTKREILKNAINDYIKSDKKSITDIAKFLYSDCTIYLTRKYENFLEFCRLEEGSSRRLSSKNGEG